MNNKKEFDEENDVYYCKTCLSLKIKEDIIDSEKIFYCGNCGSSDVNDFISIDEWINLKKYTQTRINLHDNTVKKTYKSIKVKNVLINNNE
ncbi:MAG: hypothetical protein LBM05_00590 [Endomicrobium sp.]|jgi:Zn finger protein HypA/HybF involved in hydrogenase expression|nr:hypothetical protein [Endomicrobium sp.]